MEGSKKKAYLLDLEWINCIIQIENSKWSKQIIQFDSQITR